MTHHFRPAMARLLNAEKDLELRAVSRQERAVRALLFSRAPLEGRAVVQRTPRGRKR